MLNDVEFIGIIASVTAVRFDAPPTPEDAFVSMARFLFEFAKAAFIISKFHGIEAIVLSEFAIPSIFEITFVLINSDLRM